MIESKKSLDKRKKGKNKLLKAGEGKGLGLRFLRHIERNSILLFLIPADSPDVGKEYYVLLNELLKFNPELEDKQRLIAISKCDLIDQKPQGTEIIQIQSRCTCHEHTQNRSKKIQPDQSIEKPQMILAWATNDLHDVTHYKVEGKS